MSRIGKLKVTEKVISTQYPDTEFYVDINFVSMDKLSSIRNRALVMKFNTRTREREETVDNDKFLEEYAKVIVKGWKGLDIKTLSKILAVDAAEEDPAEIIPYSQDEAVDLLQNSPNFLSFITDTLNDFEKFGAIRKEDNVKNLKSS